MHTTNLSYLIFLTYFCQGLTLFGQTLPKDTELKPELMVPIGHTSQINSLAFSPNGNLVVTSSKDNTAKIWDKKEGTLLMTLDGHLDMVLSAAFNADGTKVLTVSNGAVKLWDIKSLKLLKTYPKGDLASFSSNGKKLAIHFNDFRPWTTVENLDDEDRYLIRSRIAKFNNDWTRVAAITDDSVISLLDGGNGELVAKLESSVDPWKEMVAFSPNGKILATYSDSKTVKLWDAISGRALLTFTQEGSLIKHLSFSPKGNNIVIISEDSTFYIREAGNGKLTFKVQRVSQWSMNPDGTRLVLTIGNENTANLWDLPIGKLLARIGHHKFKGPKGFDLDPCESKFSPDGKFIVTMSFHDDILRIWDSAKGTLVSEVREDEWPTYNAEFSPDSKLIATYARDNSPKLWNIETGKKISTLKNGKTNNIAEVGFNKSGTRIYPTTSHSYHDVSRGINIGSGELLSVKIHEKDSFFSNAFNSDKSRFVLYKFSNIRHAKLFRTNPVEFLTDLKTDTYINYASFSPDGKKIVTAESAFYAKIWNSETGALIYTLNPGSDVPMARFSPDGKKIVTISNGVFGTSGEMWDAETGEKIKELREVDVQVLTGDPEASAIWVDFSHDGSKIITTYSDGTSKVYSAETGFRLFTLDRHRGRVLFGTFSPDDSFIATCAEDHTMKLWDGKSGAALLTYVSIDSIDWVVTHPSGLFDATNNAMTKLYFVQGLDVIDFNQLKERYYEPGLWKKVMTREKLRNVVGMKSIEMPPDIQVSKVDEKGYLEINLTNRGGGIGEVNIFVNGKEVIKDARDVNIKPDVPNASIKVFVGKHKSIVKGQENFIAVKAWNKDHWVQSRGVIISYQSKDIEQYKPAVHILTCGVSDYTGNEIDLKYAAKDANDMSAALQLGAKKLFGAERSYVYNLTTTQTKEFYPTKANILRAFEKISTSAHPLDIFVMYVSGHGINYGGQDGDWHYLTQEAYTGSGAAYNDPAIREQTTISSNELVELFKKIPSLKQVLMLDACASGKVVDNLMAQKDIESSTLRALDRMRDRTGMHIITGCTADAVSYEASKYGQGVLTYSLLEGIRGAALREDQYVDVNKLFQYAQDRVPQLAEGIGGIQTPQIYSPQGSQSFDIGLLTDSEKKEIPIAKIRPVYVRSNFQDENEMEDVLGLGKLINASLNEVSSKGVDSQIIFVDVVDYPEGCKLIGRYKNENGKIILRLRRKCGTDDKTYDIKANDVETLKAEILKIL